MSKSKASKSGGKANKPKARQAHPGPLTRVLKGEIERQGLSAYALAKLAGVHVQVLTRFLSGERDLRLASADKLAVALGIELVAKRK